MSRPPSRTSPEVAGSCPEIRLKYVVLPAPFGPTIAVSSPGANTQLTASTATWPPKRMVRLRVSSEVMTASAMPVDVPSPLVGEGISEVQQLRLGEGYPSPIRVR